MGFCSSGGFDCLRTVEALGPFGWDFFGPRRRPGREPLLGLFLGFLERAGLPGGMRLAMAARAPWVKRGICGPAFFVLPGRANGRFAGAGARMLCAKWDATFGAPCAEQVNP